jgi:hypothetical protein
MSHNPRQMRSLPDGGFLGFGRVVPGLRDDSLIRPKSTGRVAAAPGFWQRQSAHAATSVGAELQGQCAFQFTLDLRSLAHRLTRVQSSHANHNGGMKDG